MTDQTAIRQILALPVDQRLAILELLWDSLSADPTTVPVPDWQIEVLNERIAEDDQDALPGEPWAQVRSRIEGG